MYFMCIVIVRVTSHELNAYVQDIKYDIAKILYKFHLNGNYVHNCIWGTCTLFVIFRAHTIFLKLNCHRVQIKLRCIMNPQQRCFLMSRNIFYIRIFFLAISENSVFLIIHRNILNE